MSRPSENPLIRLIHEVHRRSLWQVLAIYAVSGWVVYEVVQSLTEGLRLPEWFPALAFVLLLIGLPIVLATAVVQEGGPGGDGEEDQEPAVAVGEGEDSTSRLFTWRNAILGGVAAFALWGLLAAGWLLVGGNPLPTGLSGEVESADSSDPVAQSVAVLPFQNLSGEDDTRPFTDGVHDDLLTQLAKIQSLKVISRTSVMEYRNSPKSMREIAGELGVAAVVEGGVQRSGDRIRVNAQLIDAGSDDHLWAETFDRRLTAENVFEIQSELARRIAGALQAELAPEEGARIADRPTDNLEAYDFYVRGTDYRSRGYDDEDLELAVEMFERAVEEDPDYTEAWAALSRAHSFQYLLGNDRTERRLEEARAAVDRALALEPDDPQGRMALGLYHYRGFQNYERALEEFDQAAGDLPGDALLQAAMASAHRRAGNWERALHHYGESANLDPRSAPVHYELGGTYYMMRRYREAIPHLERAVSLSPDWANPYGFLRDAAVLETGRLEQGRRVLERFPDEEEDLAGQYFWQHVYEGDNAGALEMARLLDEVAEAQQGIYPRSFWNGRVQLLTGREEAGRAALDSARVYLEERLEDAPDDPRVHAVLGETYGLLGRRDAAVRHGERAVELYPVERDALEGPTFLENLARIHSTLGDREEALDLLERVMEIPGRTNPVDLRYNPSWDPLRAEPRFQAVLEGY